MAKHIIWKSEIDLDEWKEYIKEELVPNFPDYTKGLDSFIEENEDYCYQEVAYLNNDYLEDERINLDVTTNGRIICIANLGLWYGRRDGYKYIGHTISDCLYSQINSACGDNEWYVEYKGRMCDLKGIERHHDGINYYLYRELKPNLSDTQIANFESKIYNGTVTPSDISRYTMSLGHYINDVYGFMKVKKGAA